ncbi:lipocalin-like domain-containing protein [Photobacterium damselae]|nr:lipocalin-like domain-containing protein [Photobacterium damselae]OBU42593.1 hypothetical protein AYY27_06900 [Photobacterium damselae]
MNISDLYGAWELVSFKHTVLDTHIETDIMGEKPKGKIIFTEDNIVSVMITSDRQHLIDSVKESERNDFLYKNMMAYMAKFDFENDVCNFHIQVSWDPSWLGLILQRKISFQDNMLVIDTLPQVGIDGKMSTATLVWKK